VKSQDRTTKPFGATGEKKLAHWRSRLSDHAGRDEARRLQRELAAMADAVCRLIVSTDYPEVDVAIEIEKVRTRCEELFPDRMELFEMIYESRFDRLWEQWR
jgi:hypothetical protein